MAFVSEMVDQLRDLLNDPIDLQVSYSAKKLYLNNGIVSLWPDIYRVIAYTAPTVDLQLAYNLPAAVGLGHVLAVELQQDTANTFYTRLDNYDVLPGDEDLAPILRFPANPVPLMTFRVYYSAPIPSIVASTYAAAGAETWTGPDRTIGLPVLYAMSMLATRRLEDRLDFERMRPAYRPERGPLDVLSTSQFWMDQFTLQKAAMTRPLPIAKD